MSHPTFKAPKTIMILGASRDRNKYGNRAVRAYRDSGIELILINPHATEIEGIKAYAEPRLAPAAMTEWATVYTQPDVTMQLLPQLAEYGIKKIFLNPGAKTQELQNQIKKLEMEPILACSIRAIGKNPSDYAPQT